MQCGLHIGVGTDAVRHGKLDYPSLAVGLVCRVVVLEGSQDLLVLVDRL